MIDSRVWSNTSNRDSTIISTSSCTDESWYHERRRHFYLYTIVYIVPEGWSWWWTWWAAVCCMFKVCIHSVYSIQCRFSINSTRELVLMMEKIELRIPEQIRSSFCWRRWRWIWCNTTGSRILRDSAHRHTGRKIDRKTNRQAGRQTDRPSDRQVDRQEGSQTLRERYNYILNIDW